MNSADIRSSFLDFFRQRKHTVVPSSPLVPANDPTLLFTNAGMVQFKDVFLGHEKRPYVRAASSQRCVRAGGKHNDLDNVGYTARHHTFFEMLGNFSFGDYFKRDAIHLAWEFLTQRLELPPERLWVTVFEEDAEAEQIWLKEIKIDPARFSRIGASDNFWAMGDTGPCGPCTEIFYDHGPDISGGPPGSADADGDRYVEIWNLVFMQYNRAADGTLTPLPKPSVDTGMGLERLAAVMQGVHSNYDIDLFRSLITAAAKLARANDLSHSSLKVIADHIRSSAFLIVDGVVPSNEGRGYVLRRIMRRAIRHGYMLGLKEPFFYKLVAPLVQVMGAAYPELKANQSQAERVIRVEEERFAETLEQGMHLLTQVTAALPPGATIPGEVVFKLYDTYGFPEDLTADFAHSLNLNIDTKGFQQAMAAQRALARASSQFGVDYNQRLDVQERSEFTGYDTLSESTVVAKLFRDGQVVQALHRDEEGVVVLASTPFYGESGGQVGDRGEVLFDGGRFEVTDTKKQGADTILHIGRIRDGVLQRGDRVTAVVDEAARRATAVNHSATHLLHAALRRVLGEHVSQKGSLVTPERLRFDFSHFEALSPEQIAQIESLVNAQVCANAEVQTEVMPYDQAASSGAMALFGEKYADVVRVLSIGNFSKELCGGTHVRRAGDIGFFRIQSEGGVAAGVRRIEAVTGQAALQWVAQNELRLRRVAELVKAGRDDVEDKVEQLIQRVRKLEKEAEQLKSKLASNQGSDLAAGAQDIAGLKVIAATLDADAKTLRDTVDQLKNKLGSAAVVLATVADGKVSLVAGVTADWTKKIRAGDLVNFVAGQVGGKGGGRPDLAQAGGTDPAALPAALAAVYGWVTAQIKS